MNAVPGIDGHASECHACRCCSRSQFHHGRQLHTGRQQVHGDAISLVVSGQHHCPPERFDRVAVDQALRRRAHHHARQVVVAEYRRLLECAAGDDHLSCAHLGHALRPDQRQQAVRIVSRRMAAEMHFDIGLRRDLCPQLFQQVMVLDVAAVVVAQSPAQLCVLVRQDDLGALLRSRQCCAHPRRAGADHQHIAAQVRFGRYHARRLRVHHPQARHAADDVFPEWEQQPGTMECLVVEAGRQKRGQQAQHRQMVFGNAACGIDRLQPHAFRHSQHIGTEVDIDAVFQHHVDIMVGQAEHATRPMVLETAAEHFLAGRPQGTGDGIAFEGTVTLAFESEIEDTATIYPFAGLLRQALAHASPHK
ncbi:hypothetical protein GALL_300750 [mine drainage metagenome]|uniref:Uncharacterized protein n=1 Tax=mine drainage metagenome TaxID=410659 RepID=A0A1J5R7N5_9ZZZZ